MICKKIIKCRICENRKLKKIINFGNVSLGNNLRKNKKDSIRVKKYPLQLNQCLNCNHFQLSHSVNPKILYATNYTYISGVTKTFIKHFVDYSNYMIKKCNLNKNSLVVDIGSNDGTCLAQFKKKGIKVCGIDPAKIPSKIANKNKIYTYNDFFNEKIKKKILTKFGPANLVTSHNVLAHVDNLKKVFKLTYSILKPQGYFCFEIGYFRNVIKNNFFDTIYHEHLDYHHALPLFKILNKVGFSVLKFDTNEIQGGTLRVLCIKSKINDLKVVKKFLKDEERFFHYNKSIFLIGKRILELI